MAKDSFVLYHSFYDNIESLSDEEIGRLTRAIFLYEKENKEIELSPVLKMAFSFIKKHLDLNREKWETTCKKRQEAGKKGGIKSGEARQTKQSKCLKNEANEAVYDSDNVSESVYVNESDSDSKSKQEELEEQNKTDFKIFGKYENVYLSESQYQSLLTKIMDQKALNSIIDSFSQNLAAKKPDKLEPEFDGKQNHFVRLEAYWEYRRKNPDKFIKDFKNNNGGISNDKRKRTKEDQGNYSEYCEKSGWTLNPKE